MTPSQEARLERALQFLSPIARPIDSTVDDIHWLDAREFDADQGPSYCQKCGDEKVDEANKANPEHNYFLAGGSGHDGDGQESCDVCGCYLHTVLTDYGVESELENFESSRLTLKGKYAASNAYALSRILECVDLSDPKHVRSYLLGYRIEKIKDIQIRVHKLTRRIDAIAKRAALASKGQK